MKKKQAGFCHHEDVKGRKMTICTFSLSLQKRMGFICDKILSLSLEFGDLKSNFMSQNGVDNLNWQPWHFIKITDLIKPIVHLHWHVHFCKHLTN